MNSFKFIITVYRKIFRILQNMFGHMNKFIPVGTFALLLIACDDAKPQSPDSYVVPKTYKEIEKFGVELTKENLRTMFLGAINFCSDVDYSKYLDNPRSNEEYKNGGNCCTSAVRTPYINLAEYYVYAMEGNPGIWQNKDNPFKLKEVRKQWEPRINKAQERAKSYDPNTLTFLGLHGATVNTYDTNKQELKFMGRAVYIGFGGIQGDWHGDLSFRHPNNKKPYIQSMPLPEKEAEKLFQYFEDNNPRPGSTPSKRLNTKITYALEIPERNDRLSQFVVRVKKVEFYYPNGWDKKIGEVILSN